ncbi:mycofactocin precursor MftA [Actinospica durhamensis]|uniref:Mycofactocin MftA n=1 Tax=Actinospica durhamensis TaxID=1508375 RepID=A0A941IMQ8_9ACTN|nr:mycofactocin precursor MftA [Actinospica durhamensis]MBR7833129.1 mycofactocin precursor MftA [Actinospica durhamensis]
MSNTSLLTAMVQAQPAYPAPQDAAEAAPADAVEARDLIEADDLVEEISIDGMCGVY